MASVAPRFEEYREKYSHVRMERADGVLELTLHSDGESLRWGGRPHQELGYCFAEIGADRKNEIIIITGAGDAFCREFEGGGGEMTGAYWDHVYRDGKRLLSNLLAIDVPVIGAVNGPAHVHAELAVLSDIVIAAESASFADLPHYPAGLVPGDGVHVLWPLLLGMNRGRYFLLTGQRLDAQEALTLGVVSEVVPGDRLLPRARELARQLLEQPRLTRGYARTLLTQDLKRRMTEDLSHGLALEGLAATEHWPEA